MHIVKTKLCRGIIIALKIYYRTVFRKKLKRLNLNNSASGRMPQSVWETNGMSLVLENTVFYVFSRPRSKAIIEPLKITVDYRKHQVTSWFAVNFQKL